MKKSSLLLLLLIPVIGLATLTGATKKSDKKLARAKEVVVYTYDSFISEWGPGPQIQELFEKETGLKLTFVDCGDGVQVLSRAVLEKNNVQADVILGLDNNISKKAVDAGILSAYKPANAEVIPEDVRLQLCDDWSLTPFDYSHFAMIYDTRSNVPCPTSLEDLTNPVYAKKIILMDPRTSTPGLGFVAWTVSVFGTGEELENYWTALKPNILTMTPGWSAGYGLFKKGEAPLVISYTTSPASHVEYDGIDYFVAPVFEEGHSIQVEGAGVLKGAPNKAGAQKFIDFLISDAAQETLPLTQWMNPANKNVKLPESYKVAAPIPEKTLSADPDVTDAAVAKIMKILEK